MGLLSFQEIMTGLPAEKRVELEVAVFDTDKQLVQSLYKKHPGKVFAVLGGGTSLPANMKQLPRTVIKIGVNQHAASVAAVDYIVSLDDGIPAKCREFSQAPIISPLQDDKHVTHLIAGDENEVLSAGFHSAIPAMMLAVRMGARQVIMCGFDLFTDGEKYFTGEAAMKQPGLSLMLDFWKGAAQALGPESKKVKVFAGSPLAGIFETYK